MRQMVVARLSLNNPQTYHIHSSKEICHKSDRMRERERDRMRERERVKARERERETERQRDKETERQRDR